MHQGPGRTRAEAGVVQRRQHVVASLGMGLVEQDRVQPVIARGALGLAGEADARDVREDALIGRRELALARQESVELLELCLLYTSPSPRDGLLSRMPSSA